MACRLQAFARSSIYRTQIWLARGNGDLKDASLLLQFVEGQLTRLLQIRKCFIVFISIDVHTDHISFLRVPCCNVFLTKLNIMVTYMHHDDYQVISPLWSVDGYRFSIYFILQACDRCKNPSRQICRSMRRHPIWFDYNVTTLSYDSLIDNNASCHQQKERTWSISSWKF